MKKEKKEGFVNIPYEILRSEGLSIPEKIIYSFIRNYSKENKKCFASNAFLQELVSDKKGPMSSSQVNGYLKQLEKQKLISRGMVNRKRVLYGHAWSDRQFTVIQPEVTQTVESIAIDSIPSTTIQPAVHTIDSTLSRYNKDYNKDNKKDYIPILVDDKKSIKEMNKEEFNKWFQKYILGERYGTGSGYKEILCNLSKEELTQLENYIVKNRATHVPGTSILKVIEDRLHVTQ